MNCADDLDFATQLAERERAQKVAEMRKANKPEQVCNADGTWPEPTCRSCGDDIEIGRLEMGRVRCFECQTKLELRNKQHA